VEPQTYINQKVAGGNDIVFGEEHGSITSTFGLMEETIRQNPGRVQAVSVEFSPRLQPLIDQVAAGTLSAGDFTKLSRISNSQEYMEIAGGLLADGRISPEVHDAIIERSENTIQAVLAGTTDESYPPEQKALDVEVYGAMHSLITTATSKGVPVIANDLGREGLLLNSVGAMTVGDLIERMDDTAGGDLLGSRADLSSSRSILVQRGSYHVWDLTYQDIPAVTNAGKGLDDYLQDKGRSVVVIGNYGSQDKLAGEVATLNNNGISVADASDATILGGQLIERPDLDLARRSLAPPTGGPSGP
jgi:hypothetical protein